MNEIVDEENYPIIPWKLELKFQNSGQKMTKKGVVGKKRAIEKRKFWTA